MSKSSSKDLFLLIKSLSKSEKRYFKLYASRHKSDEESNYLRLFDAIAKQEEYDEEEILKKETYINSLTQLKGRLYDAILKSLEMFHSEGTDTIEVRSLLNYAELLYNKNLPAQALKLLQKAKAIAERNEEFTYQMEISRFESRIHTVLVDGDWLSKGLEETMAYERSAIEKFLNLQDYRAFGARLSLWSLQRNEFRDSAEQESIRSLKGYELLADVKHALSDNARLRHYHFLGLLCLMNEDIDNSFANFSKMKEVLDRNPGYKKKAVQDYILALYTMGVTRKMVYTYQERLDLINELKDLVKVAPEKEAELMARYFNMVMDIALMYGEYQDALIYAQEAEAWMEEQKSVRRPFNMSICYFISYIYLINGSYKKSLFWLNRIINAPEDESMFFRVPALIFSMVVHYELDNREFLDYNVRSVYRYLYRRNRLYKLESAVLDFIRLSMPKVNNRNEMIEAFKALRDKLAPLAEDKFEKNALAYFDFVAWLDSKIEDRPLADVLRQKSRYTGPGKG